MSSVFHHQIPFLSSEVAILILAAGNSSRLGEPKQLVLYKGKPLITHVIEQALFAKTHSVFVVLGGNKEVIYPKIAHLPVTFIQNKNWQVHFVVLSLCFDFVLHCCEILIFTLIF